MTLEESQASALVGALDIVAGVLTPTMDERHFDDVLYWLEKARDAVSNVGNTYWRTAGGNRYTDNTMDALLDAESAVEDRIYEYRQAFDIAKGRQAAAGFVDDERR